MPQLILSVSAVITALSALGLGVAGFFRSARVEDAKSSADASRVGLEWVKEGMATHERAMAEAVRTMTRQEGLIGELRGELNNCRSEREAIAARAEQVAAELHELKRSLS